MMATLLKTTITDADSYDFCFIVETSFLGPTNYRQSRVSAIHHERFGRRDFNRVYRAITNWQHDLNHEQNHLLAVESLLQKLSDFYKDDKQWFNHYKVTSRGIGGRNDAYYWVITPIN